MAKNVFMTKSELDSQMGRPVSMDDWEMINFVQRELEMKPADVLARLRNIGMFWFIFQTSEIAHKRIQSLEDQLASYIRIRRITASYVADVLNASTKDLFPDKEG